MIGKLQKMVGDGEADSGVWVIPRPKTQTGELRERRRKEQATHLFATLKQAYSEDEFMELCFAFGIDYDSMPGEAKSRKMLAFVDHFYRHNQLEVITRFLGGDRPEWDWELE
jgi:hypothetical protein